MKCEATPSLWVLAAYMIFEIIRHDGTGPFFESVFNSVRSIKVSILGQENVLGLPRRTLARFIRPSTAACHQSKFWEIWYDIVHDAVEFLSGWFANESSSLLVPTATPLGAAPFVADNACGREEFIEFPSLWCLGYQYLFNQASSLRLLTVRSPSWDAVELSQRVLSLYVSGLWIGQSALRRELKTLRPRNRLSSKLIVASLRV